MAKDSQSIEKIYLFLLPHALVGPPGFALFTVTSTWFDRMLTYFLTSLLTYLLTYLFTYLLTCAIVCVLVCLFVCLLFFFEAIWAGFAILSCVTKSIWLLYSELEMLWSVSSGSSMTRDHLILRPLIRCSFGKYPWKNRIEFSCQYIYS